MRDQAIACYRKALKLKPDYGEAYFNLGQALRSQGRLAEALTALAHAHALGLSSPELNVVGPGAPLGASGPPALARVMYECELSLKWEGRFPALLEGGKAPHDAVEQVEFAFFCARSRMLYVTAANWYTRAFAAQPPLAENLVQGHRFHAAGVAALAGCGRGLEAAKLNDQEKVQWRNQARSWLEADLALWASRLEDQPQATPLRLQRALRAWQREPALASLREPAALAELPEAERQTWGKLWADVDALLKRAAASQGLTPPGASHR